MTPEEKAARAAYEASRCSDRDPPWDDLTEETRALMVRFAHEMRPSPKIAGDRPMRK